VTRSVTEPAGTPVHSRVVAHHRARAIAEFFGHQKYNLFTGVPCGILAPLFCELERMPQGFLYAPREDTAVAMACGSLAAGRKPLVVMQNSGLGQSVNALASLVVPYGFPLPMIVSLRGVPPDTTEENRGMGHLTTLLLDDLGISNHVIGVNSFREDLRWLHEVTSTGTARPAALLVEPSFFEWSPKA
jgi:sulfopyruvate decarboxylase subunit alpha